MNGTKSRQLRTGICALAAVGLFAATQGCSSSNGTTGTGGSSGGGTGGKATGGGSGTGTGGSAVDAGPPLCTGMTWMGAPKITDGTDVATPDGGTGLRVGTQGGVYTYGGTVVTVENGALHVTGTYSATAGYVGMGLYFDNCIDATAYSGFSYKLMGSLGNCDMAAVGAGFPQDQPPPPMSGFGVCTGAACYGPTSGITLASMATTFASMAGGMPVATVTAAAKSRITGINFGWHSPAGSDAGGDASAGGCTVDFTLDDIAFTP